MMGTNTWESFNEILDQIGRCIAPALNNPRGGYVVWGLSPNRWLSNLEARALDYAANTALLDTEGAPIRPHAPEFIRVYFPSRDHQWQDSGGRHKTAQDYVKDFPGRYLDFPTSQLLHPGAIATCAIIPGTAKTVWATLSYITNDDGNVMDSPALRQHGETLAKEVVESLVLFQRFRGWTFSGCWPFFRVGPVFSGVAYYDLGGEGQQAGLKTRLFTRPKNFNPDIDLNLCNESAHRGKCFGEDWIGLLGV